MQGNKQVAFHLRAVEKFLHKQDQSAAKSVKNADFQRYYYAAN